MRDLLLGELDHCKGRFGTEAAREAAKLLARVKSTRWRDPEELIHLHEALLFLRAYPQSRSVLRLCDEILFTFDTRVGGLARESFEYADVSGIAGTGLTTNFSYPFAKNLAARHGNAVRIDWDQYQHPERLGWTLAKLIPGAFEDWAIGPHPDWRCWYEKGGGLAWLIRGVKADLYDLFELPLRWELGSSSASRSRARLPRRKIFYHRDPLLARKDVSLEAEFAAPAILAARLPRPHSQKVVDVIVNASAVRYRELYGFLYPDVSRVFHADLGRGMDFYFLGVPRQWRLPQREYCAGMYFKNGVPMGYIEVMWREGKMEVGFNLYYTFRQGETAWLYARLLKLFHERFGVNAFVIDPYQLGHENDEAIESGAFWFYHKLGFRSTSKAIENLATREEQKIAASTGSRTPYRTTSRTLRKMAEAPVIYEIGGRRPVIPMASSIAAAARNNKSS